MAINRISDPRASTRRFFLAIAIFFPIVVLAGFARTYYLKPFFDAPAVPSLLVHIHGVLMSLWIGLFITQVYFISSKRIRLHQRLGYAGIALAALIVIVGFLTAIGAAKNGSSSTPPDVPPLAFMVVPMFDLLMFAGLFGGAIYYRKRAPTHRRLMLLTVLNFMPPAVARIPIASLQSLGPLWFFGFPDALALVFVIVDTWRNKKLNWPFLIGTIALIASHPLRLILGSTETWMSFARWVTG